MGLPEAQVDIIRTTAAIHDIGKIYVPSDILAKPGKLGVLEMSIIRTHAQGSYDILKNIDFGGPVAQIALQHHERLDGSGYPHGLKGEEIMLEARILAISDVVEAMSSHRPYRPSLGIDKALAEIRQNRGTLYDPDAVDACLTIFSRDGFKLD
jgi:HD-GYP domain-containing protein (c-di-GMP phosphodiesterase class II)